MKKFIADIVMFLLMMLTIAIGVMLGIHTYMSWFVTS